MPHQRRGSAASQERACELVSADVVRAGSAEGGLKNLGVPAREVQLIL